MTVKTGFAEWQGSQTAGISRIPSEFTRSLTEVWLGLEGEHRARYRFARQFVKGKAVLDAGCGNGYGSVILLKAGARSVTGIDISEDSINEAKNHYAAPNLTYRVGDLHRLPFPDASFDIVVGFELLEQVPEFEQVLSEFRRVLKSDGSLLISTQNRALSASQEGRENPYLRREFCPNELKEMISRYFKGSPEIYGQFFRQPMVMPTAPHIPTITESLPSIATEPRRRTTGSLESMPVYRHNWATEDDFVFDRTRPEQAPTLLAITHP